MYTIQQEMDEGLKIYVLRNEDSYIKLVPERGGIITEFGLNQTEVLYLNRETLLDREANIRGGIPILFPISGQLHNGEYELNGKTYKMKNHGFARNMPWEVVDIATEGELSITLRLVSNEETRNSYPYDFEVLYKYILNKNTLIIEQQYKNLSSEDMPFYAGFHPYFKTSQKSFSLVSDAKTYLDYNNNQEKPYTGIIDLTDKKESLLLLDPVEPKVQFELQEVNKKVTLEYGKEFKYVVCWTEQGKEFVCVEPWMAKTFEMNQKEELVYLKPDELLSTFFQIKVE
ncbi:MAG: aldose epimerase [Heyndrickxia sp.]